MAAYFGLHKLSPSAFELGLIGKLDATALTAMQPAKDSEKEPKAEGPKLPQGKEPHLRGRKKKQKPSPA